MEELRAVAKVRVLENHIIQNTRYERRLAPDILQTRIMWLECPEIARRAKPGQFVLIDCGDSYLPRPFSIHKVKGDAFAIFFAVLEYAKGTGWLARREFGKEIYIISRPLGNGFSIGSSENILLVAGGMGIAPLIFLADYARERRIPVTLLHGAAAESQLYPREMLPTGIRTTIATDDGSVGRKSVITDLIPEYIDFADTVFACGPLAMYQDVAKRKDLLLRDKSCQISLEMRMACGHGVCYGCTIETSEGLKQVCRDGPVFNLDDVRDILADEQESARWLAV